MAHQAWPGSTQQFRRKNSKGALASGNSGSAAHHSPHPQCTESKTEKPQASYEPPQHCKWILACESGQLHTLLAIRSLTWLKITKSSIHLSTFCAPGMSHRPVVFASQKSRGTYADVMLVCCPRTGMQSLPIPAHHTTESRKNHSGTRSFSLTLF